MRYKMNKSKVKSQKSKEGIQNSWNLGLGTWLLGLLLIFSLQGWSNTSAPIALLDTANTAYSKGDFEKAAQYYERIISLSYESPEVYFNLGNAYYKTDKIGMSILNYERAKKISPYDEDIAFNLQLAGQRTMDKIEPLPKLFLEEGWDNLKSKHSERTWGIRSIICFAASLFFLGVFITSGPVLSKQIGFWLAIIFFVCSSITFSISQSRHNDITEKYSGVIIATSVEIKNAPAESGTKLFILHEGTVVSSFEINGDWVKVELTKEKVGWVKKSSLEFI